MNERFRTFWTAIEDASHEIATACRRAGREIAGLSWPAALVFCVGVALIISILPLALFLFVLFLLAKLVIGAFVIERRRAPSATPFNDYKD